VVRCLTWVESSPTYSPLQAGNGDGWVHGRDETSGAPQAGGRSRTAQVAQGVDEAPLGGAHTCVAGVCEGHASDTTGVSVDLWFLAMCPDGSAGGSRSDQMGIGLLGCARGHTVVTRPDSRRESSRR